MDGPVGSEEDEDSVNIRRSSKSKNDIFGDDRWNALCVLGLRVYCKSRDLKVTVVKGANDL